jgi:hypothetical protein
MKNNKGYYNWIHSMKQASYEAHFKGIKMKNLNEEKKNILSMPIVPSEMETARGEGLDVVGAQRTMRKKGLTPSSVSRGTSNPANLIPRRVYSLDDFIELHKNLQGDGEPLGSPEEMYAAYLVGLKRWQDSKKRFSELTPSQLDDNNDGEVDGEDSLTKNLSWESGKTRSGVSSFRKNIQDIPPDSPLPTYSLAAQARQETEDLAKQQEEAAYEARKEDEQEGIEGIIDRMRRGKN